MIGCASKFPLPELVFGHVQITGVLKLQFLSMWFQSPVFWNNIFIFYVHTGCGFKSLAFWNLIFM